MPPSALSGSLPAAAERLVATAAIEEQTAASCRSFASRLRPTALTTTLQRMAAEQLRRAESLRGLTARPRSGEVQRPGFDPGAAPLVWLTISWGTLETRAALLTIIAGVQMTVRIYEILLASEWRRTQRITLERHARAAEAELHTLLSLRDRLALGGQDDSAGAGAWA